MTRVGINAPSKSISKKPIRKCADKGVPQDLARPNYHTFDIDHIGSRAKSWRPRHPQLTILQPLEFASSVHPINWSNPNSTLNASEKFHLIHEIVPLDQSAQTSIQSYSSFSHREKIGRINWYSIQHGWSQDRQLRHSFDSFPLIQEWVCRPPSN